MAKLRESTIQARAIAELESFYQSRENNNNIQSRKEARTVKKSGGKRADGLLCFHKKESQYYTVSIEAKSHRTLGALKSSISDDHIGMHGILAAVTVAAMSALYLSLFTEMAWYFVMLITVLILPVTYLLTFAMLDWLDFDKHKFNGVVEQLRQYPANEQWIAYSKYTENLLASTPSIFRKDHIQILKSNCMANGFGLLLIGHQKNEIIMEPSPKKGDYLQYYCRAQEMRSALNVTIIPDKTYSELLP